MEGSTKYNIPLDSELDINSHDMLVSVQQPKFLYNRQRFLGSLLTSSVRYEHEGWIAGWWAHEFNVRSEGNNTVMPPVEDFKIIPFTIDNSKGYKVQLYGKIYTVVFDDYFKVYNGQDIKVVTTIDRLKSTVTGKTTKGNFFTMEIDPYTGKVMAETIPQDFNNTVELKGYNVQVSLSPDSSKHYLKLIKEKNTQLKYTLKNGIHKWGNYFELKGTDFKVINNELTLITHDIKDSYIEVEAQNNTTQTQKLLFYYKDFWKELTFDNVVFATNKKQSLYLNGIECPENLIQVGYIQDPPKKPSKTAECSIFVNLPIYFRIYWEAKHIISKKQVTLEVPEFFIKRKYTEYISTVSLQETSLSLMNIIEDNELGAEWHYDGHYTIRDNSRNWLPYFPKYNGYNADIKWCPIIPDTTVQLNKEKVYGDKEKFVPNFNFNFYKQPSEANKPYIINPNYKPNGTKQINLGWKLKYKEPALIINVGNTNTTGNKAKQVTNMRFKFTKPVGPDNLLLMDNPNYIKPQEQLVPWIINSDYDSSKPVTFGTADEFILNKDLDWTLSISSTNPLQIRNPLYGQAIVQSNIPFKLNPTFSGTDIIFGTDAEEIINYNWFQSNSGPFYISNPKKVTWVDESLPWKLNPVWQEDYSTESPIDYCWYGRPIVYNQNFDYTRPIWHGNRTKDTINLAWQKIGDPLMVVNPDYAEEPKPPTVPQPNPLWDQYYIDLAAYEAGKLSNLPWKLSGKYPEDLKQILGAGPNMINIDYIPNYVNKSGSVIIDTIGQTSLYNSSFFGGDITSEVKYELYCKNIKDNLPIPKGYKYMSVKYDLPNNWFNITDVLATFYNGSSELDISTYYKTNEQGLSSFKFIKENALYKKLDDNFYSSALPMRAYGRAYKFIKTVDIYKTELSSFEFSTPTYKNEYWNLTELDIASLNELSLEDDAIKFRVTGGSIFIASTGDPNKSIFPEWIKTGKFLSTNDNMSIIKLNEYVIQIYNYLKLKKSKCIKSIAIDPNIVLNYPESLFNKDKFNIYSSDSFVQDLALNSNLNYEDLVQTISCSDFIYTYTPSANDNKLKSKVKDTVKNIKLAGNNNIQNIVQSILNPVKITLYKNFILEKVGVCSDLEIIAFSNKQITFSNKKDKELIVNIDNDSTIKAKGILLNKYERFSSYIQYFISDYNIAKFEFRPKGVISDKIQQSINNNNLIVNIDGQLYTINIDSTSTLFLDYITTDIRTNEIKKIYERNVSSINMYLKQFWSNDKTTEYFWWYDKNTVVELTLSEFIIYKKLDIINDWMGDKWEKQYIIPRENIIYNNDFYYNMSSAQNTESIFFKLQKSDNLESLVILYRLGPIFEDDIRLEVPIINLQLNNGGNNGNGLYTYNNIDMNNIAKDSKISSVVIGNKLLIGIAYSKGLDQWTIVIDIISKDYYVFWGYGYVGVNGTITGGQLPNNVVDKYGFKETIYSIDRLKDLGRLPNGCYGTGKSVSFIYAEITEICTHCSFVNGNIVPQSTVLNNNYSTKYSSTSFYYNSQFNNKYAPIDISEDAIGDNGVYWINWVLGDPAVGNRLGKDNIRYKYLQYLLIPFINHSCGSYAYVWKNSLLKNNIDTIIYSKDFKVSINKDPISLSYFYKLMVTSLENQGEIIKNVDYKINNLHNKMSIASDTSDISNSLFYKTSSDNIIENNLQCSGLKVSMTSTICEFATLDMFYNINDKIQCWAGPGFVQHSFVGICVAQSVTDLQCDIKYMDYFLNYLEIGIAALEFGEAQLTATYEFTRDFAELSMQIPMPAWLKASILAAFKLTEVTLKAVLTIHQLGVLILRAIIRIFNLDKTRAHIQATLIKYKLAIEGKHYYGQRSLSLMYPVFGLNNKGVQYTNEKVNSVTDIKEQSLSIDKSYITNILEDIDFSNATESLDFKLDSCKLKLINIKCQGVQEKIEGPADMAIVEGTQSFLNQVPFIDEQVGVSNPVFNQPIVHDYMLDKKWKLGVTAAAGEIISVSQDDTKIIDGAPSNIVITNDFCGVASSYTAIEVKDYFDDKYLRPVAMTPTALALNINRVNCVHESRPYHAFDGYSNRIISWKGDVGMDKEFNFQQYLFQQNDHFKRSNIFPPSQFMGSFIQKPIVAIDSEDQVINNIQSNMQEVGIVNDTPGEQKNLARFAIPVHSEPLSSLPAMVRMLQPYKLHVVEGVTSLCTDIRSTQLAYKAPTSIDFNINGEPYRATEEFICHLNMDAGIVAVKDIVATEGLRFVGATTEVAYFYSPATRMYYSFTGSRSINKNDIIYRFKDLREGKWDFVNQEVLLKVLLADDTGKVLIVRLDNLMKGELYPPEPTLYDKESDFKTLSMPAGFAYQGPKRFSVHRFVITENMFNDVIANKKKWERLDRDKFYSERDYGWEYEDLSTEPTNNAVKGWTHNPFKLATAMLGINEETDCKFEWSITFAWTFALEKLYEQNEYVTVCLQGETVTEGGTILGEVTHVPLYKECFTRAGDAGYFTFQFQSGNGIGNRERLYLWCDGIIAVESIQLDCKEMTVRRTQPLYTQIDTQDLIEQ